MLFIARSCISFNLLMTLFGRSAISGNVIVHMFSTSNTKYLIDSDCSAVLSVIKSKCGTFKVPSAAYSLDGKEYQIFGVSR